MRGDFTIEVADLAKVQLNPGDLMVIRLAKQMGVEVQDALAESMREAFPQNRVLVLEPGATLDVVEAPLPPVDVVRAGEVVGDLYRTLESPRLPDDVG